MITGTATRPAELELVVNALLTEGVTPLEVARSMQGAEGNLWCRASELVKTLGPASLGIIAASGFGYEADRPGTALYQVHCGSYIGKYRSGRQILETVAATAIVAAIADRVGWDSRLR